jgi:hypothetical protein
MNLRSCHANDGKGTTSVTNGVMLGMCCMLACRSNTPGAQCHRSGACLTAPRSATCLWPAWRPAGLPSSTVSRSHECGQVPSSAAESKKPSSRSSLAACHTCLNDICVRISVLILCRQHRQAAVCSFSLRFQACCGLRCARMMHAFGLPVAACHVSAAVITTKSHRGCSGPSSGGLKLTLPIDSMFASAWHSLTRCTCCKLHACDACCP